ncbi:MAG TPA: hypothetical protein VF272_03045 [Candidatus Saccharimonadia bacterium]
MSTKVGRSITATVLAGFLLALLIPSAAQAATVKPAQYNCPGTVQVQDLNLVNGEPKDASGVPVLKSPSALFDWLMTAAKQVNVGSPVPNLRPEVSSLKATLGKFRRSVLVCVYPTAPDDALCPPRELLPPGSVFQWLLLTPALTVNHRCYELTPYSGTLSTAKRSALLRRITSRIQRHLLLAVGCWVNGRVVYSGCGKARVATHYGLQADAAFLKWRHCSSNPKRAYRQLGLTILNGVATVGVQFCDRKLQPQSWTVPLQRLPPRSPAGAAPVTPVPQATTQPAPAPQPTVGPFTVAPEDQAPPIDTDNDNVADSIDQCDHDHGPLINNGCPLTVPTPPPGPGR